VGKTSSSSGGVDVVRIALVERGHGVGVAEIALLLGAAAIEDFQGAQIVALALGLRLGQPHLGRGAEPGQDGACRIEVLLHPHRVGEGQRLAPEGHGEVRVDLLRRAELLRRVGVLEVVQQREPAQERLLRRRRAGVGE